MGTRKKRLAIDKEMSEGAAVGRRTRFTVLDLIARRNALYGNKVFPGSSVDLINEAREERDRQMDSW